MEKQKYFLVRKLPDDEYFKYYLGKQSVKPRLLMNLDDDKYLILQEVDAQTALNITNLKHEEESKNER